MSENFDETVFQVKEPKCLKCQKAPLEFKIYENYNDAGNDWLQWYCTNNCGYYMNVEII
jgi:hypothetical protein